MDDFANEYFSKITKIASDFENRRRKLAKSRIKMFAAAIARQLIDLKEQFDLLLGAGNSGLFMTKIAEMAYTYLNIKIPSVLNLPIYRFKEDGATPHDNSSLITQVKEKLKDREKVKNILFVDDEIMRALTAKECFYLILEANPNIDHLFATIVAENHFFEWHYKIPKLSISFFAYSPLIQGLNGNIGHFINEEFYKEVLNSYDNKLSYNQVMAIVIGGGLKKKDTKNSYFDFEIESEFKNKIPDYDKKKTSLTDELKELVKEGIEKYKSKEIKFRF